MNHKSKGSKPLEQKIFWPTETFKFLWKPRKSDKTVCRCWTYLDSDFLVWRPFHLASTIQHTCRIASTKTYQLCRTFFSSRIQNILADVTELEDICRIHTWSTVWYFLVFSFDWTLMSLKINFVSTPWMNLIISKMKLLAIVVGDYSPHDISWLFATIIARTSWLWL